MGEEHYVAVLASDHDLLHAAALTLDDLGTEPWSTVAFLSVFMGY